MQYFDLGVGTAFWLTIISTLLCVFYGALNWNRGVNEKSNKSVKTWAKTEDIIDEGL